MCYFIKTENIQDYQRYLLREECSSGTIKKYVRDVRGFYSWLAGREADKEHASAWKEFLVESGYAPVTINSMLSAINRFFCFMGWEECRVKFLHIQRKTFRDSSRELTQCEYKKLVQTAEKSGKARLALLIETICGTGIRVSEVKYITVEAARKGRADISLKGKIRTILLPHKLCRKLLQYAKKNRYTAGEIFITKNGNGLLRGQIWREMKDLCDDAGVEESKVFPHNLRHVFATVFYGTCKDIVKLADVLGHSSIETTRIYLISTGKEHINQLERMGLIS